MNEQTEEVSRALYFTGPKNIEIREEPIEQGKNTQRIESLLMGISHGTEKNIYLGHIPAGLASDQTLETLTGSMEYPLKYGYMNIGQRVNKDMVFAFYPHQDIFYAPSSALVPLPSDLSAENAVFLANIETAVAIAQDSSIVYGETAAVFGLGIVGLITAYLLLCSGAKEVIGIEPLELRRKMGEELGIKTCHPTDLGKKTVVDIAVNLSGSSKALQQAIDITAMEGTIVESSWYGSREVLLNLGNTFHWKRQRIISSQVSHISGSLLPRWNKNRRMNTAIDVCKQLQPARFITHTFPLSKGQEAFDLIVDKPEECLQVVLHP
ncbi:MAG: zinc-dependent alcohol dehydrogenase [Spirochaetia bacterium]